MRRRGFSILIGYLLFCFASNIAWGSSYEEAYRKWLMGYLQAWNENMQRGIRRLNNEPQQVGVTSINGCLLLNETDISIPGRNGNSISITRSYNSKIWSADSDTVNSLLSATLKPSSWLGLGWDLHFEKIYVDDDDTSGMVFENSMGLRTYFKHRSGNSYIATDGSFMALGSDTMKIGDGSIIIFGMADTIIINSPSYNYDTTIVKLATKIIDPDGNITEFYYNSTSKLLDSLKTSSGQKCIFYYNYHPAYYCTSLDSIKFTGYTGAISAIKYIYEYDVAFSNSPFGPVYYPVRFLLKSVYYPNGTYVHYHYNVYGEIDSVFTTSNGTTKFEYETYYYWMPSQAEYPPSGASQGMRQYTRGILRVISDEPWSPPDTTKYYRHFAPWQPGYTTDHGQSNADSVVVTYPEGNFQVSLFLYSGKKSAGPFSWFWYNGLLKGSLDTNTVDLYSIFEYNRNGTLLRKKRVITKNITADSIKFPRLIKMNNGLKTYITGYRNYDYYGNPTLIIERGDISNPNDDRWIKNSYVGLTYYAFWLQTSINQPWCKVKFASAQGVDTFTFSPYVYEDSITLSTQHQNPTYIFEKLEATAKEYGSTRFLFAWVKPDGSGEPYVGYYDNLSKYMIHLLQETKIYTDSAQTNLLSEERFFYDDPGSIVKTYSPNPGQWQEPPAPSNVRGNLTRIERWKGGNQYTKTEYRYDNVGNIVMTITHPNPGVAETTFTYYDRPSPADKYQYAFPRQVVNHLSIAVCSLYTQTEYDSATGLVIKTYDANQDSTVYEYDNMNRLRKVYKPNETTPTRIICYKDFESPEAVVDSVKLDTRWMVTKTFFDGFGRPIQVKKYDFDNNKTIVQNISYNKNGLQDSISNPYEIAGISYSYTTPDWNKPLTSYQYDGLNRTTKVIHPDGNYIRVGYYANRDTVIDEKGNKTIYIYNAYGAIDTVIDANNNLTIYKYDTLGRLTRVIDAENKETKYYYNKLGRLRGVNGPDASSQWYYGSYPVDVYYEYDVGNLTTKKEANGVVEYLYDDIYRLTFVKHSSDNGSTWPDTVRLTYDVNAGIPPSGLDNPKGHLTKMVTVGVDSITYFYDDVGRVGLKRVNIAGLSGEKAINYKFNYADQCTLINISPSYKTTYQYNRLGQLKTMPNLITSFTYNPAGQIIKIVRPSPNSVIDTFTYDNRLRPPRSGQRGVELIFLN